MYVKLCTCISSVIGLGKLTASPLDPSKCHMKGCSIRLTGDGKGDVDVAAKRK